MDGWPNNDDNDDGDEDKDHPNTKTAQAWLDQANALLAAQQQ